MRESDGTNILWKDSAGNLPRLIVRDDGALPPSFTREPSASAELWHDHDGSLAAWGEERDGLYRVHFPLLLTFAFRLPLTEVEVFLDSRVAAEIVTDTYLRSVLPLALQVNGLEVLHASAVETDSGIAVICGSSGSGKSTLAYGLSRSGYRHWADDAVVVSGDSPPTATQIPFAVRLRPSALSHFFPEGHVAHRPVQVLSSAQPERRKKRLRCIFVLEPCRMSPDIPAAITLNPVGAFRSLLSHSYCFTLRDSARKKRMLHQYMRLTRRALTQRVIYRQERDLLPRVLDFLNDLLNDENALRSASRLSTTSQFEI